jgi:signal transduction histidine kinase
MNLAVMLIVGYLYYLSRYKGKTKLSTMLFGAFGSVMLIANYFLNSGINGPTYLLIGLLTLLIISITPANQYKIWIPVNIFIVLSLSVIEYCFPDVIPDSYHDRASRYIDISSAYITTIALMFCTILYIKRSYDWERKSALKKAKTLEDQSLYIIAQNHELERLNSEKNKLMSIIAHDLRSPLSNIQNYLELVTEYGLDTEERKIVEKDLLKTTQSTLHMLSKLLVWSKTQMEGVVVKLTDLNLLDTLKSTLELERSLASKKHITVIYDIDPDIIISADCDMLQLVVRNLVNNAIKFTPPQGTVTVKIQIINTECRLLVCDTGIGMVAEQQRNLFSLNTRSTAGTGDETGVGLGLMLCKEFTELQGGHISFESTPGKGTVFCVSLPVEQLV